MKDFYNVFGQLESTDDYSFENFADTNVLSKLNKDQLKDYINNFKEKVSQGILSKEKVLAEMKELNIIAAKKETDNEIKELIKQIGKTTIRKIDGLRLEGNLEVGGVMKSKGFYLQDGTKINEVTKVVDKLAVPIDKQGNLNLTTAAGKRVNANNLNIPKSGRITFGAGEDNDPYHLRKIGNKDRNHLRLTLNDNNNESLQIWGDSCRGDRCKPDGGKQKHAFYSNGDAHHSRSAHIKGDIIKNGGNNWIIHTPDDRRHTLYIAPSRTKGRTDWNWRNQTRFESTGEVVFSEGRHSKHNRHGHATHFNHKGQGLNYISGKTHMNGEVEFKDTTKGVTIHNGRHSNHNRHGHPTHFNHGGRGINYIGGRTHINGEVQFNDSTKGVYISNGRHRHYNRHGRKTFFNHGGLGYNSIGGRTYMNGKLIIPHAKNHWNKSGSHTVFNQEGHNTISGLTFLNGTIHTSNRKAGIHIHNAKNHNNPTGASTQFNYVGSGMNHIGGKTTLTGPRISVQSNFFNVTAHGRVSSFGSHNSGWCHITTTAPQFWMNKGLQVNGHIRGYSNKPINADKGIYAKGNNTLEGNTEIKGNLKVEKLEIGNWKVSVNETKSLVFTNKENNRKILLVRPQGSITVGTVNKYGGNHLNNTIGWCNDNGTPCK